MTSTLIKGSDARRFEVAAGRYIGTASGRFYMHQPVWVLEDVAHSLAQVVRFTGHTRWRYSVAEHSVLVSLLVEELGGDPHDQMEALLHDATESVLADVASPVKSMLPDYKALEKYLDSSMRKQFWLPEAQSEIVTRADWLALFIEAAMLMPEHGQDFADPNRIRPDALRMMQQGWTVSTLDGDWRKAREMFIERYRFLQARINGKSVKQASQHVRKVRKDEEAKARASVQEDRD